MADNKNALYSISEAARLLGVHPGTIRMYEQEGLIRPQRQGTWRYFSSNDIKWIGCLREMIHTHGISINAIKKLLHLTLCWNISDCPFEKRKGCTAFPANGCLPNRPGQSAGNICRLHNAA